MAVVTKNVFTQILQRLYNFISILARFIVEEDIDGQSFMLLNYPLIKEYWKLKTSTAISLCRHVESVILAHKSIMCSRK